MFEKGVRVIWNSNVAEIKGDEKVQSVITKDTMTNKTSEIRTDGVFVQIGELPNSDLASKAGIDLTEGGFILTDREQRTSVSGFYAAGDVTGGIKQIVVACSQGATAALTAYKDLAKPYWA
jgi:thioredoxin reductase (NADPH)